MSGQDRLTPEERTEEFDRRYQLICEPPFVRAERKVTGGDYGACSYTTLAEADRLVESLGLNEDSLLLDIGSGSGWPGVYMAGQSGCQVILTDLSIEGLVAGSERLHRDGVAGSATAASGTHLPFQDHVFDAATSSDVFC